MGQQHGITIGITCVSDEFYITLKASGTLNHRDYQTITPMLDGALQAVPEPHIYLLFDATDFHGWELRAAWDDFKLGLKQGSQFKKIAIYGQQNWLKIGSQIAGWFIGGEIEFFTDKQTALEWLKKH